MRADGPGYGRDPLLPVGRAPARSGRARPEIFLSSISLILLNAAPAGGKDA